MITSKRALLPILLISSAWILSCAGQNGDGRPAGWTEETHGNKADPSYDTVFPQQRVNRIDFVITAEDWQDLLNDMTAKYGEFGSGGGEHKPKAPDGGVHSDAGPGSIASLPGAKEACSGKTAGSSCEINLMIAKLAGTCRPISGTMVCVPDAMVTACKGKKAGDACSMNLGEMAVSEICTSEGALLLCPLPPKNPPSGTDQGLPAMPDGGDLIKGEDPIYVPSTLRFEGKTWPYVGLRFKGNSTLKTSWSSGTYKISLRVDTDKFEDEHPEVKNQRFYGFKEFSFASGCLDTSYLREKVTADLFREAGVPSPRTAFYRVYVDHGSGPLYFGLYTLIEVPDVPMLKTQFKKGGGNLYKPEGWGADWVKFDEASFAKKTHAADKDWTDVKAAIDALHGSQTNPAAWRVGLERRFNSQGFLRWLAVNTTIVNWDAYGFAPHNYYLYGDPGDNGVLHWIPWDNNMALMTGGRVKRVLPFDLSTVGSDWPLISKLYKDSVYRGSYLSRLEEFVNGVFVPATVKARIQAAHDLIKPYVVGPEGEQPGYSQLTKGQELKELTAGLSEILKHVDQRHKEALEFLKAKSAGDAGTAADAGLPHDAAVPLDSTPAADAKSKPDAGKPSDAGLE